MLQMLSLLSSETRVLVIASRTRPFCCPECRKNITDIPALIRRFSDLDVLVQNNSSNVSGTMIALEQRILKLEMEKEEVKTSNVNHVGMNSEESEEIMTEILERQKLENNILIANINEPTDTNEKEREVNELEKVRKIFEDSDVETGDYKVLRLSVESIAESVAGVDEWSSPYNLECTLSEFKLLKLADLTRVVNNLNIKHVNELIDIRFIKSFQELKRVLLYLSRRLRELVSPGNFDQTICHWVLRSCWRLLNMNRLD
ncbi:hypothetical protein HHI36_005186 [Cryptolaemus montrouzieri]|uniref:Uncharacterized protein n=1 Tax=Cryptolaemus montrouzieri TaxID=559131 RepID=A0ABD2NTH8_9CUCU